MEKSVVILAVLCRLSAAQTYGSSSMSYATPSGTPSSYGSSSMSASPASSVSYPSINLPLLQIPVTVGNASYTPTGVVTTGTGTNVVTGTSSTNFLASLPSSATYNYAAPKYQYGVYANDYDASRDYYYNHSDFYPLNVYRTAVNGIGGALNLSDPSAVSAAAWWAPYPYRLTAWDDGYTTQGSVFNNSTSVIATVTTAAPGTVTMGTGIQVMNASLYYAAYGGNIQGLGSAGLGLSVPGPAPASVVSAGLNVPYAVGTNTNTGTGTMTGTMTGMGTSYGSSAYGSSPSSSPSPSTGYGRRRREAMPPLFQ